MSLFKNLSCLTIFASILFFHNAYADTCIKPKGLSFGYRISGPSVLNCLSEGLAVYDDGRYEGYVDINGNIVIEPQFYDARSFKNGSAMVRNRSDKWQLIDKSGKVLNSGFQRTEYGGSSDYYTFEDRFFDDKRWYLVQRNKKFGVINSLGEEILPLVYDWIGFRTDRSLRNYNPEDLAWDEKAGFIEVKRAGKYGAINREAKEVIPAKYDKVWMLAKPAKSAKTEQEKNFQKNEFNGSTSLIALKEGDDILFYNINNKQILPDRYDSFYDFDNGLARVKKNNKIGFIDQQGKLVIPIQFEDAWKFGKQDDLALVKLNGKYGYIDHTGKLVIDAKYDSANTFIYGSAKVTFKDGNYPISFEIDTKGNPKVKRSNIKKFQKNLVPGDSTNKGLVLEVKGKLALIQIERKQCSQRRDNDCVNYIRSVDKKWVKKSELYPHKVR